MIAEAEARFLLRDRPACITCGAELQAGRCPWAFPSRSILGADGRTYCDWPRDKPKQNGGPAYLINPRATRK